MTLPCVSTEEPFRSLLPVLPEGNRAACMGQGLVPGAPTGRQHEDLAPMACGRTVGQAMFQTLQTLM